mmetsp:Transcript_23753/g.34539  ORF Transcript_23753/g.34539 Transcript_23753/m.34539 type:complete len:227 (+) Transcript_23753:304-984(+)
MAFATRASWYVPIWLMTPPVSMTPSAPTITRSTVSIMCPMAASSTICTGMPSAARPPAIFTPDPCGRPSDTTTLKFFPVLAARSSSSCTPRLYPWVNTTVPSLMNPWPRSAILALLFSPISMNFSPRLNSISLQASNSGKSRKHRVTYLRKRSHPDLTGSTERPCRRSGCFSAASLRASAAADSSTSRPIMVAAWLLLMTPRRALIAAIGIATSGLRYPANSETTS